MLASQHQQAQGERGGAQGEEREGRMGSDQRRTRGVERPGERRRGESLGKWLGVREGCSGRGNNSTGQGGAGDRAPGLHECCRSGPVLALPPTDSGWPHVQRMSPCTHTVRASGGLAGCAKGPVPGAGLRSAAPL